MSVRDIAKRAGVSITTVSRVLNNHPQVSSDVRDRVLSAANRSRYMPTVGRRSTTNIAFVYTGAMSLGSPFDAALMQGMSEGLQRHGFDLMILDARRARQTEETFTQMFIRKGVRGAILRTTLDTRDIVIDIADEGFPAVVVADVFQEEEVACVGSDSRQAVSRAIDHLLHLGHRRIAITLNVVDDHDHAQRLAAYRDELARAGLPFDERLVLRVPAYRDAGAAALSQLMSMTGRPTAAFITDPLAAIGVFHEAQRTGVRIPDDLSIIGFDDGDARFGTYPRMSAVCQNAESLGREAFNLLDQMMNDQTGGKRPTKTLDCWLELLGSTGAVVK